MKYNRILTPLGITAHRCFLNDFWGIGTSVAGLANLAGTLITNKQNVDLQREINQKNIENQWQLFRAQNARQDYLNANQDLIKRQSLQRAGLNVNSEFGGYPNIATNSVSPAVQNAPVMNAPDFSTFATLLQNAPLVKAQARKENADAERQEIENERERSLDKGINKFVHDNLDTSEVGDLQGIEIQGGQGMTYNKGTLQAQQLTREWQSRLKELDKNDVRNVLDKLVTEAQLKDNRTIQALRDMPYYEQQKLSREIDVLIKQPDVMDSVMAYNYAQAHNADTQAALNELEEEITRNTNINELIHKYLGDGSLADFAQVFVMIVGALTGNMRFGANVSSFKGKVKSSSKVQSSSNNTNHNINYSGN